MIRRHPLPTTAPLRWPTGRGDYVCDVTGPFGQKRADRKCSGISSRQAGSCSGSFERRQIYGCRNAQQARTAKWCRSILIFSEQSMVIVTSDNSFEKSATVVPSTLKGDTLVGVFESMLTSISTGGLEPILTLNRQRFLACSKLVGRGRNGRKI